jgi:hypothetical protein
MKKYLPSLLIVVLFTGCFNKETMEATQYLFEWTLPRVFSLILPFVVCVKLTKNKDMKLYKILLIFLLAHFLFMVTLCLSLFLIDYELSEVFMFLRGFYLD